MSEIRTTSKVGARPSRILNQSGEPGSRYTTGYVATRDGVVGVYMEDGLTSLILVTGGREHRGYWARRFQDRALITLCKRFAAEIAALSQPPQPTPGESR